VTNTKYSFDQVEQLRKLWATDRSARMIGDEMGISFNAVMGLARRHKLPRRDHPIQSKQLTKRTNPLAAATAAKRDLLADMMAEGCPSVFEASRRLGWPQSSTDHHWRTIVNDLGREQCQ